MLLQTGNHHNEKAILEKKNKSLYLSNSQSFVIGVFERGKKKSIIFFFLSSVSWRRNSEEKIQAQFLKARRTWV